MRRLLMSAVALAATLFLPLAAHSPLAQGTASAMLALSSHARVIVKYRAGSALLKKQAMTAAGKRILQTQALGDRIGIALRPGLGITDRSHVVFASGVDSKTLAARIAAESDVEYAVPDERKHIVAAPNDSYYASGPAVGATSGGPLVGQWYLKPPGAAGTAASTAPSSINAEQAWDLTTGSASIVVADIDTGLRFDHPDLRGGNVLTGYDMIGADEDSNGASLGTFITANDGNGRDPDASDPGDWVDSTSANNPNSPLYKCTVENSSWHGTQTAGLIGAATNNSIGIASVGYGNVKVMPVRVLGRCGGFDSDIIAGMLWAAGVSTPSDVQFPVPTPARVLNMSLGGTGTCNAAYQDAVNLIVAAGTVIVVAAGNGDANGVGTVVGTPANCSGVVAVAAVRAPGDKVGFSDLGPEIAISAPGGNCVNTQSNLPCLYPIMTTSNSGTMTPVVGAVGGIYTDAFNASLGTSFSTPLVTGTVALMLSVQPSMTPAEVKTALQASARPFPTTGGSQGILQCAPPATAGSQNECYCTTAVCGAGMLDAHAAVLAALGVQARITDSTASPTAGSPVVLTSTSAVGSGDTISSYVWAIASAGTTGVTITSGQGTPTLTVMPTAAGTLTASLTATDTFGNVSTASTTVAVAAASGGGGGGGGGSGGGTSSGGGALGIGWFSLLLAAVLALAAANRAERRRATALSAARRLPSHRR